MQYPQELQDRDRDRGGGGDTAAETARDAGAKTRRRSRRQQPHRSGRKEKQTRYGCEGQCGFTGGYDEVVLHEQSCDELRALKQQQAERDRAVSAGRSCIKNWLTWQQSFGELS